MFEAIITAIGATGVEWLAGALAFLSVAMFWFWPVQTVGGLSRLNYDTGTKEKGGKQSVADRRKEIQDQLRKQEEQNRRNNRPSLEMLLIRARMETTALKMRIICGGIGMGVVSLLIVQGIDPIMAMAAMPIFIFFVPVRVAKFRVARLQKRFIAYFPDAIDVLVRGVRTGLPVGEGMRLVGREMPEPVAGEFKLLTDATAVGVTLEDALGRMFNRMPLAEVNFFNIVLTIQKQTGGNLSEALGNLSNTLRERKKLKLKIKALSSEAKASAMIIGSLPFVLACVLFAVAPDYLGLLFNTDQGNMMLGAGAFWMSIGIFCMYSMIDIEI